MVEGMQVGWPRSTEDILTTNTTSGAQMGTARRTRGHGFQ
jgi:hypothetical protein